MMTMTGTTPSSFLYLNQASFAATANKAAKKYNVLVEQFLDTVDTLASEVQDLSAGLDEWSHWGLATVAAEEPRIAISGNQISDYVAYVRDTAELVRAERSPEYYSNNDNPTKGLWDTYFSRWINSVQG